MDTLYVQAASKKQLNTELAQGGTPIGVSYTYTGSRQVPLRSAPDRTIVKLFLRRDGTGNPIAVSYGSWNAKKQRVD